MMCPIALALCPAGLIYFLEMSFVLSNSSFLVQIIQIREKMLDVKRFNEFMRAIMGLIGNITHSTIINDLV